MNDEVEYRIEWAEDVEWDEDVAGWRAIDQVAYVDDEEVSRHRCPEPGYYSPDSTPGSQTSEQTQAEIDEVAFRRAAFTGKPVAVAGFSSSGNAQVSDGELRDGELELVPVGTIPITPSPPPKIPPPSNRPPPAPVATAPVQARTMARPREQRARSSSAGGSRASPSSEGELDEPPPVAVWRRWLRRLLEGVG